MFYIRYVSEVCYPVLHTANSFFSLRNTFSLTFLDQTVSNDIMDVNSIWILLILLHHIQISSYIMKTCVDQHGVYQKKKTLC